MEFCSAGLPLGLKVSSDKPSVDGFEAQNLIAESQLGFMCESFIRPPVIIRFDFPLPIDISHINLEAQLGERRSNGFKVSTFVNAINIGKNCNIQSSATSNTPSSCLKEEAEQFNLGNWFSLAEKTVILKNYNYKHWFPLPPPSSPCEKKKSSEMFIGALRNVNKKALNCVSSVVITVTSVYPSGSPVLKGIEIWGQPSSSSSPSERKKIIYLWKRKETLLTVSKIPSIEVNHSKGHQEDEQINLQKVLSEFVIPDEFLDPLTCEIMRLPILLPSGNSVDSSSLEKFIGEEAKWGRPASDPFTGVRFKESFKPEPNVHLKARIDRFLLIEKNIPSSYMSARGHILTDRHAPSDEYPLPRPKRKGLDGVPACDRSLKKVVTIHSLDSSSAKDLQPSSSSPPASSSSESTTQRSEKVSFRAPQILTKRPQEMKCGSFPSSSGEVDNAAKKGEGRHKLVRAIGAALCSTSKHRNSLTPVPRPVLTSPHDDRQTSAEEFSLLGIALNPLKCPCGNQAGVFYSLRCSHKLCSQCVHRETNGSETGHVIQCRECGHSSHKHQLSRAHPQSVFAS